MPPILDVAIGVVFVFLLFSLVVSALNELILSALKKRAQFLEECLAELLGVSGQTTATSTTGQPAAEDLLSRLLQHGLVDSLSRDAKGKVGKPAYLPPAVFVSALLDLVCPTDVKSKRTMDDVKGAIAKLDNEKLKQTLTAIVMEAGDDLAAFKAGIEVWFNQGMARVSGWYKRYSQVCMFVLGLALAIGCNVDTVHIVQALSSDSNLRGALAKEAVGYVGEHPAPPEPKPNHQTNLDTAATSKSGEAKPTASDPARVGTPANTSEVDQLKAQAEGLRKAYTTMSSAGLPIGWQTAQSVYFQTPDGTLACGRVFAALFGWLLTALAGSLGAPFWFDTLNRFINIRGDGRAPEEGDPTNPGPKAAAPRQRGVEA